MTSHSYLFLTSPRQGRVSWPALLHGWLPVVVLLSLFAVESTPMLGADHTSSLLRHFTHAVTGAHASIDTHWSMIHHLIRKTGHFLGYGMLSLAWLRALLMQLGHGRSRANWRKMDGMWRLQVAAIALTFAVAGLDELHQSFLPNRTGTFSDVLLDTAGALSLQMILRLAGYLARIFEAERAIYTTPAETAAA